MLSMMMTHAVATPAVQDWVDSVYNALTPRQRVAQLFIPHVITRDTPSGRALLRKLVAEDGVGGMLLGKATVADYASLNDFMQRHAQVPLMITADAEWGLAMRLPDAPRFPRNLALGATANTQALEDYGRETARELRRLGITVSFAPVADVNSNPRNPVIGTRSFGEDPRRVADLSAAYARGLRQGGVMAVAKHFPGHGDTSTDSHKTLPVVNRTASELESIDLVPFRRMVSEGIDGIMVAHVTVPKIDSSGLPASLSPAIITDMLQQKLGFEGLVFTDALEMEGAQQRGRNNCVMALQAGADVLLGSKSPSSDIDAVMAAIADGRLNPERVERSVRKLLAAKYELGLDKPQTVALKNTVGDLNAGSSRAVSRLLGREAVTVVRNDAGLLPLNTDQIVEVEAIGGRGTEFVDGVKSLRGQASGTVPVMVVGVYSSKPEAVARLKTLRAKYGEQLVPVFFINPYHVERFAGDLKGLPTVVVCGDDAPGQGEGAAKALFGSARVSGHLPVGIPGIGEVGQGVVIEPVRLGRSTLEDVGAPEGTTARIDSVIDAALSAKAMPGCQVMVIKDGDIVYERNAGRISSSRNSAPVTARTLYDLASVSKVAGTMAGMMAAYDDGLYRLDEPVGTFDAARADTPVGRLTLRQLMHHETGLPASLNPYKFAVDTASYSGALLRRKPDADHGIRMPSNAGYAPDAARLRPDLYDVGGNLPVARGIFTTRAAHDSIVATIYGKNPGGNVYRYSDLNFCLLMDAEQRLTGAPHEQWFADYVAAPLGNDRTLYRPLEHFSADEIAATEVDPFLRRQTIHGYVHDETAALAGGVEGNAGLFSNAMGLAKWLQMLMNGGTYGGIRMLDPETVNLFLNERSDSGRRGLGWDVNGPFIGHTGFTGTCVWLDPARRLAIIVLTNRVNPTRDNAAFRAHDPRTAIRRIVDGAFTN